MDGTNITVVFGPFSESLHQFHEFVIFAINIITRFSRINVSVSSHMLSLVTILVSHNEMFRILSGLHTGRCNRVGNRRWCGYTFGLCYISSNLSSKFFSPKSVGFLREVEISSFTPESHSTFHWSAFCHQSLCWAYGNQENMDAGFSNQILTHSSPLLCCFGKLRSSPKYSLGSKDRCAQLHVKFVHPNKFAPQMRSYSS